MFPRRRPAPPPKFWPESRAEIWGRRLGRFFKFALILGLIGVAIWLERQWSGESATDTPPATLSAATARAIDGDSLKLGTTEIRLSGIDAPELKQSCERADGSSWPCGKEAKQALAVFLQEGDIVCTGAVHDKFARTLAICATALTPDINAALVQRGWAISNDAPGREGAYGAQQDAAQKAKRGIWQGRFEVPHDWRETHNTSTTAAPLD